MPYQLIVGKEAEGAQSDAEIPLPCEKAATPSQSGHIIEYT